MRVLCILTLSIVLGVLPLPVGAQHVSSTVDFARLSVHDDSTSIAAMTVSPYLRVAGERGTFGLAGTLARFETGSWTSSGTVHGAVLVPIGGAVVGELAALSGGSLQNGALGSAQMLLQGRMHLMGAHYGLWAGGGGGSGWDGVLWRAVISSEGGVWWREGPLTMVASIAPTQIADSIGFADSQLALRVNLPRMEVGAAFTTRSGERLLPTGAETRSWGSLNAAFWFSNWGALVATGGSFPADILQGYAEGRFASVGVRLGVRPHHAATGPHWRVTSNAIPSSAAARRQGLISFTAKLQPDGTYLFQADAPDARNVEIMGDFTGWKAVSMRREANGLWTTTLVVAPGTHHMNVRLNQGAWLVPPGVPPASDEFGVHTGLLVVR
jgi:hypothetical protein